MKKRSFFEMMSAFEQRKRGVGTESTADLYRAVRNRLVAFCGEEKLLLKMVTAALVSDFAEYLKKEQLKTNTVNTYLSCFRAMYNRACRETTCKQGENPFAGIRLKREETSKRAISGKEIEKLEQLDFSGVPAQRQALDLALFCFLACGMPFVDLVHLTRENIQDHGRLLVYRRKKTGVLIQVRLNAGMKYLINRYACKGSPYLFSLLPEDATHEEYKATLATFNRHLKEIGKRAGLAAPLTSYVFRHSWASEAYRKHIELSVISQALGHTSEKTTRLYLAKLDQREITHASQIVSGKIEKMLISKGVALF